MKNLKPILFGLISWLVSQNSFAQQELVVNLNSGINSTHILNSVRSLKFTSTSMTIEKEDNTSLTLSLNTISNLRIESTSITTNLDDNLSNLTDSKVYPNPVNYLLTVSYHLGSDEKVNLDLYSLNGENILNYSETGISGTNVCSLPLAESIQNGVYILKISTRNIVKTFKVIKY